jgi:3-methyladenine DNA glycosylase/8-oxoguanine DNA glycosylase
MRIESNAPHDFYLTLDVDSYFEAEYEPMEIFRYGYPVPLGLAERDVFAVLHWNEDPEDPVFEVEFPEHDLTEAEEEEAKEKLRRVVGADIDLEPFYELAEQDPVLAPLVEEHYGFKRLSRATFYEDAIRSIIKTRIAHDPTARRMVKDVREAWGQAFVWHDTTYYTYPRPEVLKDVDPEQCREYGVSKRKGEYITGMARDIVDGTLDLEALEQMDPADFYEAAQEVRGIGPSTAQSLMLRRNRNDAAFPSHKTKGKEKGIRRWILMSYGMDPHETPDKEWDQLHDRWRGHESLVSQYFFFDWVMREKAEEA